MYAVPTMAVVLLSCFCVAGCGSASPTFTMTFSEQPIWASDPAELSETYYVTSCGVIKAGSTQYCVWEGEWMSSPRWGKAPYYARAVMVAEYDGNADVPSAQATTLQGFLFTCVEPVYHLRTKRVKREGDGVEGIPTRPPELIRCVLLDTLFRRSRQPEPLAWTPVGQHYEAIPRVLLVTMEGRVPPPGLHRKLAGRSQGCNVGIVTVSEDTPHAELALAILDANGCLLSEGKLQLRISE